MGECFCWSCQGLEVLRALTDVGLNTSRSCVMDGAGRCFATGLTPSLNGPLPPPLPPPPASNLHARVAINHSPKSRD